MNFLPVSFMVLILALCSYWTWRYIGHAVLCLMRPIGLGKTLSEAVLLVRPTLSFLPSGLSAAPEAEPWHMLLPVLARTLWLVTTECCILRVCCVFVSPGGCCHLCRVERWHQGWWGHLFCVSVPRCSSRSLAFFFFSFGSSRTSAYRFPCLPSALLFFLPSKCFFLGLFFFGSSRTSAYRLPCLPRALLSSSPRSTSWAFFASFVRWLLLPFSMCALALPASVLRLARSLFPMGCSCSRWIDVVLLRSLRAGA